jgi:hypothetical protein
LALPLLFELAGTAEVSVTNAVMGFRIHRYIDIDIGIGIGSGMASQLFS